MARQGLGSKERRAAFDAPVLGGRLAPLRAVSGVPLSCPGSVLRRLRGALLALRLSVPWLLGIRSVKLSGWARLAFVCLAVPGEARFVREGLAARVAGEFVRLFFHCVRMMPARLNRLRTDPYVGHT